MATKKNGRSFSKKKERSGKQKTKGGMRGSAHATAGKRTSTKTPARGTSGVVDTYNDWISRQVRASRGKTTSRGTSTQSTELPKNTFNEWLKNQRIAPSDKTTSMENPSSTFELWMTRQVKARNRQSGESETTEEEASGSNQVLLSPRKDDSKWQETDEITIAVSGRKSGKRYSTPVWFVFDEPSKEVSLIPVHGKQTNWFRNMQSNQGIEVSLGEQTFKIDNPIPEFETSNIQKVEEKFRAKYGSDQFERFYPSRDAVVRFTLE